MSASIRTRLSAGLAISLIALISLQWLLVALSFERLMEAQLATRLSHDIENLLAGVQFDRAGSLVLKPERVNLVYQRPFSGLYYVVRSGEAMHSSRSLWDTALPIPEIAVGEARQWHVDGPQNQSLFVLAQAFSKQNRNLTVAVAEDTSSLNAEVRRFTLIYALLSAAVLLLLLWIQRAIVERGLAPLNRVRAEMLRLRHGETDRVSVAAPDEISPMVAELNRLLSALANRTQRSRVALGNLAHALKTQLAVLKQVAARPEFLRAPELRHAIETPMETMRTIVERELRRARLSGPAMPGQNVPIADELAALESTLRQLYSAKKLRIAMNVSAHLRFSGDREDFLEMAGNLLDNACKWARTRVNVEVSGSTCLTLLIEDDGPGCDEDQLDALMRRGFRADESIPGSGLGLAIVKDVIDSYQGHIRFCNSPTLGGFRVEIRFPSSNPELNLA